LTTITANLSEKMLILCVENNVFICQRIMDFRSRELKVHGELS